MPFPHFKQEKSLIKKGYKFVAGIDEAGRGAWAGPLVAAAVILDPKKKIKGIKDSKLLRSPDRSELFEKIIENSTDWGVGVVSQIEVDKLGLTKANHKAMQKAVDKLKTIPHYILVDGFNYVHENVPSKKIIDGDHIVRSIAAASIIAKVTRDRLMDELDEKFPAYGLKQHKGYGTAHHFAMLNKHGISQIHRKTFKPIKDFLTK